MNRKPLFDTVRSLLGRGVTQGEVQRLDRAIDEGLQIRSQHRLGGLSERFESGGRGAGTVSDGKGDPGGVSYGTYQLASRTGTAQAFMRHEGARWSNEFGGAVPGSRAFSRVWKKVAEREPQAFADAQHAFIERTHYRPAVRAVRAATGLDLDSRHPAVRDAVWSVAVQHGGAARILEAAVAETDAVMGRQSPGFDRRLIEAIYARRSAYVRRIAGKAGAAAARTLESIVRNRYPAELKSALAMFG